MQIISGNKNNYIKTENNCNILLLAPNTNILSSNTLLSNSSTENVTFINKTNKDITVLLYEKYYEYNVTNKTFVFNFHDNISKFNIDKDKSFSTYINGNYYCLVVFRNCNTCLPTYTVHFTDSSNNINSSFKEDDGTVDIDVPNPVIFTFKGDKKYNIIINVDF
jgi:hypothetical protein